MRCMVLTIKKVYSLLMRLLQISPTERFELVRHPCRRGSLLAVQVANEQGAQWECASAS